ncbi:MAG TPA: CDP-alcohol phosphatidyltransferase family protein [Anaerolineales bacterium]|nr:CDP-alcohol phosphatidyltransferase family protein [Anaerolineales bacterium]
MVQNQETNDPFTLTDWLRSVGKVVLEPIAGLLNRLGLTPNTMTILGLVGNTIGAYFLWQGNMLVGGLIILVMGPIDALDGTMARLRGEPSKFGAFVDSVTDRYSELVIFLGLLLYYNGLDDPNAWVNILGVYLAAAGSVLVSYVRARAQSLGYEAKVGILTRVERYAVLAPSLIFNIPWIGVWIIAILANITAVQRILFVRKLVHAEVAAGNSAKQE